jgi:FkbM family methyltransferase
MATDHGTLIVNRNDYRLTGENAGYGIGHQLMTASSYEPGEVALALSLLRSRRMNYGSGVLAVDCGAHIGVHTIEWARLMFAWGTVISFEPQEPLFYALAGNIAINNCLNVRARLAAVGAVCGTIGVPAINYYAPTSFGSLELTPTSGEYIGQVVDYSKIAQQVPVLTIDSLGLPRLDFIKIDVEGMEAEVLQGAADTVHQHKPQMIIEVIKADRPAVHEFLASAGYHSFAAGPNIVAVHDSDPVLEHLGSSMSPASATG